MSEAAVCVEALVKEFRPGFGRRPVRVLDDVSFAVQPGEIFGFVGPNGAGKTTTLKTLMGLIRPTSGRLMILGHDVAETEFRKHVGFLPEAPYFYDYLTGREFLRFYAKVCGVDAGRREERIQTLLDWVGLASASQARLRTYSKGMLQRIGIAQALIHDPQVVFLDEPMSGLDPIGRKEIRDLIRRLQHDGKSVFMNTHILSDVEMLCDRVAIIVRGRICFEGRTDEVMSAGEGRVEVVCSGLAADVAADLEADFDRVFRARGDCVEISVPQKSGDEVVGRILGGGGSIVSVSPRHQSLEDVFLHAVEAGQGEGE